MKLKCMCLVAFYCLFLAVSTFAGEIVYRKAAPEDLPTILEMTHTFSEEDKQLLVTYPKEIEGAAILGGIRDGIYLAFDREQDHEKLVSMVKLYVIAEADLDSKLREVGAIGLNKKRELAEVFKLTSSGNKVLQRHELLASALDLNAEVESDPLRAFESRIEGHQRKNQLFVYYGGAYTDRAYRNQQLHSKLLRYGVRSVFERDVTGLHQLVFVYGQVKANSKSKGAIFEFADSLLAQGLELEPAVFHLGYFAIKPNLLYDVAAQRVREEYPPENEGVGHLVFFTLAKALK